MGTIRERAEGRGMRRESLGHHSGRIGGGDGRLVERERERPTLRAIRHRPEARLTAAPSSVYASAESSRNGRMMCAMRPSGPMTKTTRR